jgi:exosortase
MNDLTKTVVHFFSGTGRSTRLLPVFVFGWLWFVLINQLRVEWTNNPQYSYGWAVPFLCLYLAWQKCRKPVEAAARFRFPAFPLSAFRFSVAAFFLLAFLYAPTRLIQEANPEWHLVSWALAVEVIGLTLCVLWLAQTSIFAAAPDQAEGPSPTPLSSFPLSAFRFSDFVFPLCFFFVAVPWPAVLEGPLIQGLTRLDARITVELLGWIGIPAVPHGNVIEVATGEVGVSEACSGIRSFQATLMISLFLGELFSLSATRRLLCVLGGFAMSFLFNLARMSLLVWVAAKNGVTAIEKWHDPAGMTILAACFCGLWGLGEWFAKREKAESGKRKAENIAHPAAVSPGRPNSQPSTFNPQLILALAVWIVLTEAGVEAWYSSHELRQTPAPQWVVNWPTNNSTFREIPLETSALQMLRCDENRRVAWKANNLDWEAVFLRWNPGGSAHLGHTPNNCMSAVGHTVVTLSQPELIDAGGFHLRFITYEITDRPRPFYIFYCLWDDRFGADKLEDSTVRSSRISWIIAGLRRSGQRSLEIAIDGAGSAEEAKAALRAELAKLLIPAE